MASRECLPQSRLRYVFDGADLVRVGVHVHLSLVEENVIDFVLSPLFGVCRALVVALSQVVDAA